MATVGVQDLQAYALGGLVLLAGLALVLYKHQRLDPVANDKLARARHREAWRQLAAASTPADYRQVLLQCGWAVEHIQRARAGAANKLPGFPKVNLPALQRLAGEIFALYLLATIYAYADGEKRPVTVQKIWREWFDQNPPSKAVQAKAKAAAGITGRVSTSQQNDQLAIVMKAWRRGELGMQMYRLLQDGERFFADPHQWRALQIRMLHFARDGYALAPDDCWRDSRQVCERNLRELDAWPPVPAEGA